MYVKLCTGKIICVISAPHHSGKWVHPGYRAAAGGGRSHGPERFRWMAAPSCCSMLGSGTENKTGNRKQIRVSENIHIISLRLSFQMHVAELLVSHGASLNAKTFLEETPIGIFTTILSIPQVGGWVVRGRKQMSSTQQGLISSLC